MKLEIGLFVRRFHGGQVLVRVAPEPDTCVFAEELEDALVDLELLLGDRLERTHPRSLHRLASPDNAELASYVLGKAMPVHGAAALERRPMRVSCVISRHKEYDRLWFPSWKLRHWVAARGNVQDEATKFLAEYLPRLEPDALLGRRIEQAEELHTLTLELEPAPLAAFTGRHLGAEQLPAPVVREGEEEERAPKKERRIPTPRLQSVAVDLTERARKGELRRAVELDAIVDRVEQQLESTGGALVLVGAPGSGKTTAIHELAHRLAKRDARKDERRLWFADGTRLIASRGLFSDWRSETLGVIDEITATGDVWYLGSVLALLDAGKSYQSEENVAQLLRPHLIRRRLRVIGEATTEEWARLELRDPSFARAFTPIRIDEPEEGVSLAILRGVGALLAKNVTVGESAVRAARELGARFGGHASVHAASLALLSRTIEDALSHEEPPAVLERKAVVATFCRESGMPPVLIQDDLALDSREVRAAFEARIVGQPEAVTAMVDLVGMLKAGLSDPSRPLGSYLFVGPTGVGKTETAKALAEILYGSARRMVRFDMSELATGEAVQRFVGLGGQPGKLVSEIRKTPFCVLLLDEIEKAHPVAFDALLQVLGEARLSDEAGRTASFRNVVVVMTSNLGADTLRANVGFGRGGTAGWAEHFVSEARKFFRPELFNRIDHVVPFAALDPKAIEGIAARELDRLARREGLHHRGIRLEVPDQVRELLVERGIDVRYGARPLKRALEQGLAAPIARHLASMRSLTPGVLRSRVEEGEVAFTFERARAGDGRSDEARRRALVATSELRYFVDRCGLSTVLRDLRLEANRIERLLATPRYLRGYESLRKQLAHVGRDGELLAEFEALRAHAESLEDLAHELAHKGDGGDVEGLRTEHAAVVERIKALGLGLAARGVGAPDRAILVLATKVSAAPLWRRLFRTYGALAQERGWNVRFYGVEVRPPRRIETEEEKVKAFADMHHVLEPDDRLQSWVERLVVEVELGDRIIALRFDGPNAGLMLRTESGAHEDYDAGQTQRGLVRFVDDAALLEREHTQKAWGELLDAFPKTLRRTVHHGRGVAEDRALGMRVALEPRLERVYERFMLAALYDGVFFPGAQRALSRGLGAF